MNEDYKKLFDAVSQRFDIGDYESFQSKMQTPEDRKRFYDALSERGLDLGDYNSYEERLKKKDKPKEKPVEGAIPSISLGGELSPQDDFATKASQASRLRRTPMVDESGEEATVKFQSAEIDGRHVVYPTLYPKDPLQYTSSPEDWMELDGNEAIDEAFKRGELFEFESAEMANAFAEGAWKKYGTEDPVTKIQEQLRNEQRQSLIESGGDVERFDRMFGGESMEAAKGVADRMTREDDFAKYISQFSLEEIEQRSKLAREALEMNAKSLEDFNKQLSETEITSPEEAEALTIFGQEIYDMYEKSVQVYQQTLADRYVKRSDEGDLAGAMMNQAIKSSIDIAAAGVRFSVGAAVNIASLQAPVPISAEIRDEILKKTNLFIDAAKMVNRVRVHMEAPLSPEKTTDEYIAKRMEEPGIESALLLTAYSLPMMSTGSAGMILGYAEGGYEMAKDTDMTEDEKLAYGLIYGTVAGTLEKAGLQAILGVGMGGKIANRVIEKMFNEGKKFELPAVQGMALSFGRAAASEGLITGSQEAVAVGMEETANFLKNKDIFEPNTIQGALKRVAHAGEMGMWAGGLMGAPVAVMQNIGKATPKQFELAEAALPNEAARDIKEFVESKVKAQEMTPEEGKKAMMTVDAFREIAAQIPQGLPLNERLEAFKLIKEQIELKKKIEGKHESLTIKEKLRIEEINEELQFLTQEGSTLEDVQSNKADANNKTEEISGDVESKSKVKEITDTYNAKIEEAKKESQSKELDTVEMDVKPLEQSKTQQKGELEATKKDPQNKEIEDLRNQLYEQLFERTRDVIEEGGNLETDAEYADIKSRIELTEKALEGDVAAMNELIPPAEKKYLDAGISQENVERFMESPDAAIDAIINEQTTDPQIVEDARKFIENSDPLIFSEKAVLEAYISEVNNPTYMSPVEDAIADNISSIRQESFAEFGDRNNISQGIAKTYLRKDGAGVAEVAQAASEQLFGNPDGVSTQDVIDFMMRFPNGYSNTPANNPKLATLNDLHIQITGKGINRATSKQRLNKITKAEEVARVQQIKLTEQEIQKALAEEAQLVKEYEDWLRTLSKEEISEIEQYEPTTDKSGESAVRAENAEAIGKREADAALNNTEPGLLEAAKQGTKQAIDFIEKQQSDLRKFGSGTLGMNIPVAVADAVLTAAKLALKGAAATLTAAQKVAIASNAALKALRESEWYKSAKRAEQRVALKDVYKLITGNELTKTREDQIINADLRQRAKEKAEVPLKERIEKLKEKTKELRDKYQAELKQAKSDAKLEAKALQNLREAMADVINNIMDKKDVVSRSIAVAIARANTKAKVDAVLDRIQKMTDTAHDKAQKAAKEELIKDIKKKLNPQNWSKKGKTDKLFKDVVGENARALLKQLMGQYDGVDFNSLSNAELSLLSEAIEQIYNDGKASQKALNELKKEQRGQKSRNFTSLLGDKFKKKLPIPENNKKGERIREELNKGNVVEADGVLYSSVKQYEAVYGNTTPVNPATYIIMPKDVAKKNWLRGYTFRSMAWHDAMTQLMGNIASQTWIYENLIKPVVKKTMDNITSRYRLKTQYRNLRRSAFGSASRAKSMVGAKSKVQLVDANGQNVRNGELTNDDMVYLYNALRQSINLEKFFSANYTAGNLTQIVEYIKSNPQLEKYADGMIGIYEGYLPSVNAALKTEGYAQIEEKNTPTYEELEKKYGAEKAAIYYDLLNKMYNGNIPATEKYAPTSVIGQEVGRLQETDMFKDSNDFLSVISNNAVGRTQGGAISVQSSSVMFDNYVEGMTNMVNTLELYKNFRAIFSPENLRLIESVFGKAAVSDLKTQISSIMLDRNANPLTNNTHRSIYRWLNRSSAVQMFLNTRSAVFQTLSTANYALEDGSFVDWVKNFSTQFVSKEGRKNLIEFFNQDWVKSRIEGNASNIELQELRGGENGYQLFIDKILDAGYITTASVDAMAIALGGAPFYTAKTKQLYAEYKKTMPSDKAMEKAREEASLRTFELSQLAQQSSSQAFMSSEQKNPIVRIMLTFGTVSLQYSRLMYRSALDLKNGRGNKAENISKLLYYGIVQNMMFNIMSRALSSFMPDGDEDEDAERAKKGMAKAINGSVDSILKGFGSIGAVVSATKNILYDLSLSYSYKEAKDAAKEEDAIPMLSGEDNIPEGFWKDMYELLSQDGMDVKPNNNRQIAVSAIGYLSPTMGIKTQQLESVNRNLLTRRESDRAIGPRLRAASKGIELSTNLPVDKMVDRAEQITDAFTYDLSLLERFLRVTNIMTKYDLEQKIQRQKKRDKNEELIIIE